MRPFFLIVMGGADRLGDDNDIQALGVISLM